jgi:hypothetical protein
MLLANANYLASHLHGSVTSISTHELLIDYLTIVSETGPRPELH